MAPVADHGELAVRAYDARTCADLAVLEGRVGADDGVLGDHRRAEQLGAGEDRHVLGQHDVGVDPRGLGIQHRHAVLHPAGDDPPVELAAERGELGAVVGALGLPHVVDGEGGHGQAGVAGELDRVGQVVLALRVVVADPVDRVDQEAGVEGEDAGVDLPDLALLVTRVLLLDDREDLALAVADDPAVAGRGLDDARQDADRGLRGLVLGGEPLQGRAFEERGVAVGDEDGASDRRDLLLGQRVERDPHRMAGAELLLLDRQHGLRQAQRGCAGRPARAGARSRRTPGSARVRRPLRGRGRSCSGRRSGAGPSSSWTSSWCRLRRPGR